MSLLIFAVLLITTTIFWSTYDPSVTGAVELSIVPTQHTDVQAQQKIRSGEHVGYNIPYKNNSDVVLTNVGLAIELPSGFVILDTQPNDIFTEHTRTFSLGNIAPGGSGSVAVSGLLYGVPDQEQSLVARLSYIQEGKTARETKPVRMLVTPRGSVIEAAFTSPNSDAEVFAHGSAPVAFSIKNPYHHDTPPVSLVFPNQPGVNLQDIQMSAGTLHTGTWSIASLAPDQTINGTARLVLSLPKETPDITIALTPQFTINGTSFTQTPAELSLRVRSPNVAISGGWSDGAGTITPGQSVQATVHIKNNSDMVMQDPQIRITLNNTIVDTAKLSSVQNNILTLRPIPQQVLNRLGPGEETTISVVLPIRSFIETGDALSLTLTPTLVAKFSGISTPFETSASLPERKISTSFQFAAESRYYTDEGDQLGRGPLPPAVGKETKYWGLITLTNGTNTAAGTTIIATLPAGVTATGKKSITTGKDVILNNADRSIRWTIPVLAPHEEAGLYLELAITPTEQNRGATLPLLTNIKVEGKDDFTGATISASASTIDTSLPRDDIAQTKGTRVQ